MNLNKLFLEAAKLNILPIMKLLVNIGIDPRQSKEQALIYAATKGHLETVKYLVSVGCDPGSNHGFIALAASINGHYEVSDYLNQENKLRRGI
jgi:ankyrin repeat protein